MKHEVELGQKHQRGCILLLAINGCAICTKRRGIKQRKKVDIMNSSMKLACLIMVVAVMAALVQESSGHPCGSTFFSALVQLIPCRAAVAPFSPIPPTEACCASIKALGQPCLCVLVNGPPISGVDRAMALQLPEKCTANFEPCEMAK